MIEGNFVIFLYLRGFLAFYLIVFFFHRLEVCLEVGLLEFGSVRARAQHVVCGFLHSLQAGLLHPLQLDDLLFQ